MSRCEILLTSKIAFKARKKLVSSAKASGLRLLLVLNESWFMSKHFSSAQHSRGWKASCGRWAIHLELITWAWHRRSPSLSVHLLRGREKRPKHAFRRRWFLLLRDVSSVSRPKHSKQIENTWTWHNFSTLFFLAKTESEVMKKDGKLLELLPAGNLFKLLAGYHATLFASAPQARWALGRIS